MLLFLAESASAGRLGGRGTTRPFGDVWCYCIDDAKIVACGAATSLLNSEGGKARRLNHGLTPIDTGFTGGWEGGLLLERMMDGGWWISEGRTATLRRVVNLSGGRGGEQGRREDFNHGLTPINTDFTEPTEGKKVVGGGGKRVES